MCVYVHVYYTFIVVLVVRMGALIMCVYVYFTVALVALPWDWFLHCIIVCHLVALCGTQCSA